MSEMPISEATELSLSGDFKDYLLVGPNFDDLDLARSTECPRDIDLADHH